MAKAEIILGEGSGGGTPFLEIATSSQGGGYVFTRLISYNNGTPTVQEYYVNSSSGTPITGEYIKILEDRKIQAVVACKCLSESWSGSVTIANYSAGDYIISSPSSSGNIVVVLE